MNLKKVLALVLAGTMCVSAFTGCGGSKESAETNGGAAQRCDS